MLAAVRDTAFDVRSMSGFELAYVAEDGTRHRVRGGVRQE